jgi:hypothetical protein
MGTSLRCLSLFFNFLIAPFTLLGDKFIHALHMHIVTSSSLTCVSCQFNLWALDLNYLALVLRFMVLLRFWKHQ